MLSFLQGQEFPSPTERYWRGTGKRDLAKTMNPLGKSPCSCVSGILLFFSETLGNSGTDRKSLLQQVAWPRKLSLPSMGKEDHAKISIQPVSILQAQSSLHLLGVKVAGKHKGQEEPRYSYDNSQKISLFTWVWDFSSPSKDKVSWKALLVLPCTVIVLPGKLLHPSRPMISFSHWQTPSGLTWWKPFCPFRHH